MSNLKKGSIFLLVIGILFAVGFLSGIVIRNLVLQNSSQQQPVKYDIVTLELKCDEKGGNWSSNECENIDEASCNELGGEFNPCASPCRNSDTEICATVCVEVCKFVNLEGFSSTTDVTLEIVNNGPEEDQKSFTNKFAENESVFNFLERLEKENSDFTFEYEDLQTSKFITTINGVKADKSVEFWSFLINGNETSESIADYILQEGDVVGFVLKKY